VASEGRPDLIMVGDVMTDVSVRAGSLAKGGDVHGEVRVRPAGSGANGAVWAAAAGARVRLHGRVGDDLLGRLLAESLRERGVEPALKVEPSARTGAMLVVHELGDRSMVADRGANACLRPQDLPDRLDAPVVLVSGYLLFDPGSEAAARAGLERATGWLVAVEAASWPLVEAYGPGRFFEATAGANFLLANEAEARALTGRGVEGAMDLLLERYEYVVLKQGAQGAMHARRGYGRGHTGTEPVEEVDPTGAGDAFDGMLLARVALGDQIGPAIRAAVAAGARAAASTDPWPELE
jgi:sugar/nucleoside kinase (ribokinase family)